MRGWKMRIRLISTIGNNARIPVTVGPTRALKTTTETTSAATMPARNGTSYRRRAVGGIDALRNRWLMDRHAAKTTALSRTVSGNVQPTVRAASASTTQTPTAAARLTTMPRDWAAAA